MQFNSRIYIFELSNKKNNTLKLTTMYANKEAQQKAERTSKVVSTILLVAAIGGSIAMGLIYLNKFGWIHFYSC